jgi:hypothetical protein
MPKQLKTNKIIETVKEFVDDYNSAINVTKGNSYVMPQTINKISLYRNSKFVTGDIDFQGNKKYFYNIVKPAVMNVVKNIDIDTKNIRVTSTKPAFVTNAMVYNEALKQWMKEEGIGYLINNTIETLSVYGSCMIKKTTDGIKLMEWDKVMIDPAINNDDNSFDIQGYYVIEEIYMTATEVESMKSKGWDDEAVDNVLDAYMKEYKEDRTKTTLRVYEAHVYMSKGFFGGDEEDFGFYKMYLTCNCNNEYSGNGKTRGTGNSSGEAYGPYAFGEMNVADIEVEEIMFWEEEDEMPYKKNDYVRVNGRALGLGVVEELFDAQRRVNQIKNDTAVSMQISSKHLFQTPDETIEKNIMQDLLNGDIIKSKNGITPISNEERNIAAWNSELQTWGENARANANAFEALTGEELPSSQTLGGQQLTTMQGAKFFDFMRENLGMFFSEVLMDWVLPMFEKQLPKELSMEVEDSDLANTLIERDFNRRKKQLLVDAIVKAGRPLTQEEVDIIEQTEGQNLPKTTFTKVTKEFLKDFDKKVQIDITGEANAVGQKITSKVNILNIPNIQELLINPVTKPLVESLLEDVGLTQDIFGKPQGQIQPVPNPQQAGRQLSKGLGGSESISPAIEEIAAV